ncbi:MAG: oligosaccharide flippase family protein [Pseudomonadota bacterium]
MIEPSRPGAAQAGLLSRLRAKTQRGLKHNIIILAALGVRGGAVVAGFAVTYLIGSNLGAAATGQFALISQTALFLSVVALLGLNVSVVRHFTKAVAAKVPLALGSALSVAALGFGLMLLVSLILWLGGDLVWKPLVGDSAPRTMLVVLCLLLIARGGVQLLGGMLRSQHSFTIGQAITVLFIPCVTAIALASGLVDTVHGALWAAALGGLASIILGSLVMVRHVGWGANTLHVRLNTVVASSLPLWGVGIAQNIGDWYSLAVAAQMLSAADAGLYRVGVQIAMALQIVSKALFSVYSAQISAAFHASDRALAARLANSAVKISGGIAIPVAIVLLFAGEFILAQFGPEFEAAWPVLVILIVGQVASTLTGPCGLVLAMSGNERLNLAITIVYTALVLASVPVAAHFAGLAGIALSMSLALLARNLTAFYFVRSREGINVWTGRVANRHQASV